MMAGRAVQLDDKDKIIEKMQHRIQTLECNLRGFEEAVAEDLEQLKELCKGKLDTDQLKSAVLLKTLKDRLPFVAATDNVTADISSEEQTKEPGTGLGASCAAADIPFSQFRGGRNAQLFQREGGVGERGCFVESRREAREGRIGVAAVDDIVARPGIQIPCPNPHSVMCHRCGKLFPRECLMWEHHVMYHE